MKHTSPMYRRTSHPFVARVLAVSAALALLGASASAQAAKKPLTIDDYSRWRSIDGSSISGDGNWVAYGMRFTNTPTAEARPVLHLLRLDTNQDIAIPNGSGATFSSDSRWVVYQVEPPAGGGRGGRGRAGGGGGGGGGGSGGAGAPGGGPPAPGADSGGRGAQGAAAPSNRRIELRNLATGTIQSWQDIQSATFSPTVSHLILRRRAAGAPAAGGGGRGEGAGGGGGGGAAPAAGGASAARGADIIIHDLATGRSQHLGSVGEMSFSDKGDFFAYTIDAAPRDGNGLFVRDMKSGRIHTLDNDARIYSRLTWNDEGTALAVLKGQEVERQRERENLLLVYPNVQAAIDDATESAAVKLDPATAAGFPKGWVVSERGTLTWSDDNKRIFLSAKEQVAVPDTSGRRRGADFIADVDVWRTQDQRLQSVQMNRADAERNFTYRQAFDVGAGRFVRLTDSTMRDLEISADGRWAVGRDTRAFVSDYERARADVYRVNTATGERTLMFKGALAGSHLLGTSAHSKYFLYWKDNHVHAYDLDAGTSMVLTKNVPVSFVDTEFDHPGPKPSYGVAGYSRDAKSVILEHRYDLWLVSLDGSAPPRSLTNGLGAKNDIRFAIIRTESNTPGVRPGIGIDLTKPVLMSAYGQWTKKAGFYELANGEMRAIVFDDAAYGNPTKAAKADKFLFTRQTFAEFPDLRVSGLDFKDAKKITNANPQHSEFLWGRRILFDYKNKDGVRLQGTLAIPDDYQPGEKRPMLVNFYEKNSQNLNRYMSPSFLSGMGSLPIEALTRGYLLMQPDVHFTTGRSHSDMLECVEAAVKKVIEMGYVDPKRIGVNGHSYGGEGAAFIGVRSKLFAAVGMGAGVTDLTTDFSQNWGWSYQVTGGSGANGNDYYLYGQGRWGTDPWASPELFRYESAITHARDVTVPFLIMHGTADPTVSFQEGLNFYNALRYNKKNAVLLAYPGEGHGLRGLANRRDLTIRYMQFFDHYLKGTPAPKWVSDGVPFLAKDGTKDPGQ